MSDKMETPSTENLCSVLRYYTGHPREVKPSKVIDFKSERQFVELLHEGAPVVVAFTLRCPWTKRFDRVMEDASSEWYPHIKFMRVECPKYPGFCIARQRKDYPFVEIFHSPKQGETEGGAREGSVTRYSVNVLPFNYDMSPYGFREFFKIHGLS
ncbi:hypothetical protein MPTK1_7g12200 [Marchantia polymorpha subsp. ruderalis]|uniref:Thioredoxin domain-containing protein n=2 Tax=Marchantia polymorpha TaxID=3197 RepID=A0AAF6BYP2_MARPO|nr:hypothetical protein MARPO_0003s0233 [Marchantia polymorpha]BBN17126.1 hypothetical protein Mp_7g12200 [Marchantia polymorpha subsp. ruderalis]|eukprot:PTQ49365.1 hypothetical protein MARPO_0003s0233 [Marchantia polymorpha]